MNTNISWNNYLTFDEFPKQIGREYTNDNKLKRDVEELKRIHELEPLRFIATSPWRKV